MGKRPSEVLDEHRDEAREILARHGLGSPRVFGSAANGTDHDASDLDLLFDPGPHTTLFDLSRAHEELSRLLRVPVDLVPARQLPEAARSAILARAVPL